MSLSLVSPSYMETIYVPVWQPLNAAEPMITLGDKSDVSVKQRVIGTADSAGIVGHGREIHGVGLGTAPTCHFYHHDIRCVFVWAAYRSE